MRSSLACLTKKRLITLARDAGLTLAQVDSKEAFIEALGAADSPTFAETLAALSLAELRSICATHELATSGTKAALTGRILAQDRSKASNQTSLLEQRDDDLDQVIARAKPSVVGIIPMLDDRERATLVRRLREHHAIDLPDTSAASVAANIELPLLLSELDRDHLLRIIDRYALAPASKAIDVLLRTILAAAAGVTDDEALQLESPSPAGPTSEPAAQYRAALGELPRGVLHRVEANFDPGEIPRPGELVRARHRQYLVSEVIAPRSHDPNPNTGLRPSTLVKLVCLDDDAQGRELDLFWELEVGATRIDPSRQGLASTTEFDPPPRFGAYYHALRWNCVTTATTPENERIQAPFRAGIAVMQHQLVPLQKVLALPRANLFIADDVGLGKTIEAGLILQELLLRQRLDLILIVCPAAISLQWQTEMERRFGLRFEIMNREQLARIRRERGVGTNPWECGRRFIVSYQTLRRPGYQESLRTALGERRAKSMLVLDEAHNVAPAGNQQRYAIDSQLTKLARQLAPRFENRLFLSATPHNGHSNSFSALLELLDPTRFTRGVPVEGARENLDAVMVRRLKRDLIGTSTLAFPERKLVELRLINDAGTWQLARIVDGDNQASPAAKPLGKADSHELELSALLDEYKHLCAPTNQRDHRVFIGLQKRLLSSCAAFSSTLQVHLVKGGVKILERLPTAAPIPTEVPSDETHGEELDGEVDLLVSAGSPLPKQGSTRAQAETLLERMQELLRGAHSRPEAKLLGILDWIRQHICPAAARQWFDTPKSASKSYTATRLIIFTEYADTANYIIKMLRAALDGTELDNDRIAHFHGAMSDDQRRELQANFNAHPDKHPVRILVATDAAREGVNLQSHCADLIHYDIPWNPGRLEQRNGRIDRTLQPSPEVRCMYFALPQRREDRVLDVLVKKVERIHAQLGSLSAVVLARIEANLDKHGIDQGAQQRLELGDDDDREATPIVEREVESIRPDNDRLSRELESAADCYERSREFFAPDADGLRETLSMALALAGAGNDGRFEISDASRDPDHPDESTHYTLPSLPPDWAKTLDTLRPARPQDVAPWEWRNNTPPKPVVFEPLQRMTDEVVQLHLEHPVVRRALARFTAQGYAAHDLHRATLVRYRGTHERVVIVARMSLFGRGASRLHDGLLHLVAEIRGDAAPIVVERERDIAETLDQMQAGLSAHATRWKPSTTFVQRHRDRLAADLAQLWPRVDLDAKQLALELTRRLEDRGAREAEQLHEILSNQRRKITKALVAPPTDGSSDPVARQRRLDYKHMQERRDALGRELDSEPQRLREHYQVSSQRIEAVGIVYLIPESR